MGGLSMQSVLPAGYGMYLLHSAPLHSPVGRSSANTANPIKLGWAEPGAETAIPILSSLSFPLCKSHGWPFSVRSFAINKY